jgi:hypothetical protein
MTDHRKLSLHEIGDAVFVIERVVDWLEGDRSMTKADVIAALNLLGDRLAYRLYEDAPQ